MTTNYFNTLIAVAEDCPAAVGETPPAGGAKRTVASLQHELIANHPYTYTSDDVLFEVHVLRHAIPDDARTVEREAFFAKEQPCLRSSSLSKRYGWGIHHDQDGRVALVSVGSREYDALAGDTSLKHIKAMRSRRA